MGWKTSAINMTTKRYFGAFWAAAILLGLLSFQTSSFLVSLNLTVFWLIGGFLGGNFMIIVQRGSGARSWCGVLFGSVFGVLLVGPLITGLEEDLMGIAATMTLPTAVLYGCGKIGCKAYGCCGWPEVPSNYQHRIQLQTLEAIASFFLAVVLITMLAMEATAVTLLAVFFIGHGMQRVLSKLGRSQPLGKAFIAIDSGFLLLCGVYYAL